MATWSMAALSMAARTWTQIWNQARGEPVAAAAVAIASVGTLALVGAWIFEYGLGLAPCPLCLEQRYAYYVSIPLAAMVMLGITVGSSRKVFVLAFLAIGAAMLWNAGLGVYHSGVEWQWWQGPLDCAAPATQVSTSFSAGGGLLDQIKAQRVVRCDEAPWRFLGLSLAGYNALISLFLAAVAAFGVRAAWQEHKRIAADEADRED